MMRELLLRCQRNLSALPCCHTDGRPCNCYNCLQAGFYNARMPDKYDCPKKMNYYVLNYGPSFSSEFYYYLQRSNILNLFRPGTEINVLSIGCGFAPDLIATLKYIGNQNLSLSVNYTGIDNSTNWQTARFESDNCRFVVQDVLHGINLSNYDIVVLAKVFSTINRSQCGTAFLRLLNQSIRSELRSGAYVIFNDINSIHLGRDLFHNSVFRQFRSVRQFFFRDRQDWMGQDWIQIPDNTLAYRIPRGLSITPLNELRNNVVFEYRK